MRFKLFQLPLALVCVSAFALANAHSQDTFVVRVKVTRFESIDRPGDTADPYAVLEIDGKKHKTGRLDDKKTANTNWVYSVPVASDKFARNGKVNLSIGLKDYDSIGSDDTLDINPLARQKNLIMNVRVNTAALVGQTAGELCDPANRPIARMTRTSAQLWTSGSLSSTGAGDNNRSRIFYCIEVACLKKVFIAIKIDQPQDDSWSCGPNSLSRLLRSTGVANADYKDVRRFVKYDGNVVSLFGLGAPTSALIDGFKHWKRDARLEENSNLERVIEILMQGKPLIALISLRKVDKGIGGAVGKMHYIVINGYDPTTDKFSYTNTSGRQGEWTRAEFMDKWSWQNHFTGVVGETAQGGLEALGMRKRSILY